MSGNGDDGNDDLESRLQEIPRLLKKRERDLEVREEAVRQEEKRLKEDPRANHGKDSDVVKLSVGGTPMSVLRRTLTQVEGSVLASMFSGRWDNSLPKEDGRFFIDQDPKIFQALVSFLRQLSLHNPDTMTAPGAPSFTSSQQQVNFFTMLEYYGMTNTVYQIGCE
ncbi:MAG: hypothetical protein SGARI_004486 [Bacillariaceae sp.]